MHHINIKLSFHTFTLITGCVLSLKCGGINGCNLSQTCQFQNCTISAVQSCLGKICYFALNMQQIGKQLQINSGLIYTKMEMGTMKIFQDVVH